MNEDLTNLTNALNEKGFETIANDISIIVNDSNVELTPLMEVEQAPTYDQLYITESVEGKEPHIDGIYEKEVLDDLRKLDEIQAKVDAHKEKIKAFIESNDLGSFKGAALQFKYTSATTTTSIDTTRLKKELPDIAAQYSKVGSKASSISIKEL